MQLHLTRTRERFIQTNNSGKRPSANSELQTFFVASRALLVKRPVSANSPTKRKQKTAEFHYYSVHPGILTCVLLEILKIIVG